MRRLCSLAVRPFSVAAEASGAPAVESAASRISTADGETEASDVTTRHLSFKDMNRNRTRAKVEAQMWGFLRSRECLCF